MVATPVPSLLLVVDLIDEDTGLAEVEDDQGRTYAFPAAWLPGAADGQAYRALVSASGLRFVTEEGGAALLREKSKQTLLDFSDDFSAEQPGTGQPNTEQSSTGQSSAEDLTHPPEHS